MNYEDNWEKLDWCDMFVCSCCDNNWYTANTLGYYVKDVYWDRIKRALCEGCFPFRYETCQFCEELPRQSSGESSDSE